MTRIIVLLAILWITETVARAQGPPFAATTLLLGFVLLASHLAGQAARWAELPRITGYMVLGILVGPFVLGTLHHDAVVDFRLINEGALCLIALAAGGELRVVAVRERLASILLILVLQVVMVFGLVAAVVYAGRDLAPFLQGQHPRVALAAGLIFGLVAVAKSPATTIAVITEERARGILTDTVLGVTVVKDVVVLILIALLLPLATVVANPAAGFSFATLAEVGRAILASIAAGLGLGWLLRLYLQRVDAYRILVVFITAFVVVDLSARWHLEYILIAMAAGFYVQNFSSQGRRLLHALEANSLPVYALFFAVAGADLRIDILPGVWQIALLMIGVRMLALVASTWAGAHLAGDPPFITRYAWMGFVAQAGVTLGIANLVRDRFDVWGADVAAVIVAMIAVNQLVGPPAFRYSLLRAGESRARERVQATS